MTNKVHLNVVESGFQPTMSYSWLLLECAWAFGRELDRGEVGEPARYGSAYHWLLAGKLIGKKRSLTRALKAWRLDLQAAKDLRPQVSAGYSYLTGWLAKNEYGIDFTKANKKHISIEKALALTPGVSARVIPPHDKDHHYHGIAIDEIAGTLDYAVTDPRLPLLLLDHKTGEEDFSRPLEKAQLLTICAAMLRLYKRKEIIAGVHHARRRGMPKIYSEKITLDELKPHEERLAAALRLIGSGLMRPGPQCVWCPGRNVCPARDSDLLSNAGEVLNGLTAAGGALSAKGLAANDVAIIKAPPNAMSVEKKLGLLFDVVRKAEVLAKRCRAEIRDAVIASGGTLLPETPQGEYLVIREFEQERLSKGGIVQAYGVTAGARMLDKLRADGAIRKFTVQQLWAEKEK